MPIPCILRFVRPYVRSSVCPFIISIQGRKTSQQINLNEVLQNAHKTLLKQINFGFSFFFVFVVNFLQKQHKLEEEEEKKLFKFD